MASMNYEKNGGRYGMNRHLSTGPAKSGRYSSNKRMRFQVVCASTRQAASAHATLREAEAAARQLTEATGERHVAVG